MRSELCAVLVIVLLQGVMSVPLDKAEFTCPSPDGFYPIPGQCSSDYYTCISGSPHISTCPAGNIFDPELLICVTPDSASCRTSTAASTSSTGSFTCTADGLYPAPGQVCTAIYVTCVNGTAYYSTCPGATVFDPVLLQCVSFSNSTCSSSSTPGGATTEPSTRPTAPSSNFTCPQDEGFFTNPGQCSGDYFACVGGIAYPQQCPGSAIFDEFSSSCVSEQNAYCKHPTTTTPRTTTTPTTTTTTTSTTTTAVTTTQSPNTTPRPTGTTVSTTSGPFRCPAQYGDFDNPDDCKTYYHCVDFVPTLMTCPPGLVFNPVLTQCDWPFNVPGCTDQVPLLMFREICKSISSD